MYPGGYVNQNLQDLLFPIYFLLEIHLWIWYSGDTKGKAREAAYPQQ